MVAADTAAKAVAREKREAEEAAWHRPRIAYNEATDPLHDLKELTLENISRWELVPIKWFQAAHDWGRSDKYKYYADKFAADADSLPHLKYPGVSRLVGLYMQSAYDQNVDTRDVLTGVVRLAKSPEFRDVVGQIVLSIHNWDPTKNEWNHTNQLRLSAKGPVSLQSSRVDVRHIEEPVTKTKSAYGQATLAATEFEQWSNGKLGTKKELREKWTGLSSTQEKYPGVTADQIKNRFGRTALLTEAPAKRPNH